MPKQKFKRLAVVRIADDLRPAMSLFEKSKYAVVLYTHGQEYGGDDYDSYALYIQLKPGKWTRSSWYEEDQLTAVTDPDLVRSLLAELEAFEEAR